MRKSATNNLDAELLTIPQTCEVSNLGTSTVRRIAEESGAIRKIGRSVRIKRAVFFGYIDGLNESEVKTNEDN
jgi:hypothetical protein